VLISDVHTYIPNDSDGVYYFGKGPGREGGDTKTACINAPAIRVTYQFQELLVKERQYGN